MTDLFPYIVFGAVIGMLLFVVFIGFQLADAEIDREKADEE